MKILISGSLAYDRIMDFPGYFKDHILPEKVHLINVSFTINKLKENFGGTAGNIAYSLKLLEEEPTIISSAGKDFNRYKNWLRSNKIKFNGIKIIPNELTACAYIITDKANNQISAFHPGAMMCESTLNLINKNSINLKNVLAIIAPGYKNEMIRLGHIYKKKKIPYIFDPGQQIPSFTNKNLRFLLDNSEIFVVNDYEFSLVSKRLKLSLSKMKRLVKIIIITKGEKGSLVFTKQKSFKVQAIKPKKVIDPTGAGDAFRSGLIKGIINNYTLKKTIQLATLVATYPIEYYGTQEHYFTLQEIKGRFYKIYKSKLINN